jgi:nitroreductase
MSVVTTMPPNGDDPRHGEVMQAIRARRNVRAFSEESIDLPLLTEVVDAARHAPSSMNDQRWAFVVVTERARLSAISKMGTWADHVGRAGAAVALVVPDAEDPSERESIAFDLGQAAQNLMLAAWEKGLGSCHATIEDREGVRDLLGIPDGWTCDLVISLGRPGDPGILSAPPRKGGRKRLQEVLRRERW